MKKHARFNEKGGEGKKITGPCVGWSYVSKEIRGGEKGGIVIKKKNKNESKRWIQNTRGGRKGQKQGNCKTGCGGSDPDSYRRTSTKAGVGGRERPANRESKGKNTGGSVKVTSERST